MVVGVGSLIKGMAVVGLGQAVGKAESSIAPTSMAGVELDLAQLEAILLFIRKPPGLLAREGRVMVPANCCL